jgi:hypothetical protein
MADKDPVGLEPIKKSPFNVDGKSVAEQVLVQSEHCVLPELLLYEVGQLCCVVAPDTSGQ